MGVIVSLINFIAVGYYSYAQFDNKGLKIFLLFAAVSLILLFVFRGKDKYKVITEINAMLSFAWIVLGNYWLCLLFLFLSALYFFSSRNTSVFFREDKITFSSFPQRSIQWHELSNVILKDGLLTIDFKNNRLIQQAIFHSDPDCSETEFNTFCRRQLNASVPRQTV